MRITFIALGHLSFWDILFKKSSYVYIDKNDTIDHLIKDIPKAKIIKKLYHPHTGYEINVLKVPDSYSAEVSKVMADLERSLLIKERKHKENFEIVMESLLDLVEKV